jgi:hypothetical protein
MSYHLSKSNEERDMRLNSSKFQRSLSVLDYTPPIITNLQMLHSYRLLTKERLNIRRLLTRRDQLLKELLSPQSQLISSTRPKSEYVWVDSNFLRRFFSCQDNLEDLFQGAQCRPTIFRRESFVCEHSQGLHPRVARQGISKSFPPMSFLTLYALYHTKSLFLRPFF